MGLFGKLFGGIQKTRSDYLAAQRAAMDDLLRGDRRFPSWYDNNFLCEQMFSASRKAVREVLTERQVDDWFIPYHFDLLEMMATAAAAYEKAGFGVTEQIVGAAEVMKLGAGERLKDLQLQEILSRNNG